MKITNKYNLPSSLVKAVENDDYNKGDCDYSVTGLLNPPLINRLLKQHEGKLSEDVSDRMFSLMGSAMHAIIERADDQLTEKRLYAEIDGFKISGQTDRIVLSEKLLQDYKFMSTWEIIYGLKPEKTEQLNIYRWLLNQNNIKIDRLEIVAMLRDWSKSKSKFDKEYPQSQILVVPVDVWSFEKTEQFIKDRIKLQQDESYICTASDRWSTGDKWAVMKKGNKRAVRLFDHEQFAIDHVGYLDLTTKNTHFIEFRKGEDKRCEDYCPVKNFCEHRRK